MWKVAISVYNRLAQDSYEYMNYFNSKQSALEYIDSLGDINADVYIEDMTPIGDDEYTDGEITWIREAIYY